MRLEPHTAFSEAGIDDGPVGELTARRLGRVTRELRLPEDAKGTEGPDEEFYWRIQPSQTIGNDHYPVAFKFI